MLGLILIEIAAILWLFRETLRRPLNQTFSALEKSVRQELSPLGDFLTKQSSDWITALQGWIWFLSGCITLSGVLWGFHLCFLNYGSVFSGWDTLFSWNHYAEIWTRGRIPNVSGMYTQLIASNWSISHLLQGKDAVQFSNTLLPPVFFLMIEGMLFGLGFQHRESGFLFAAIIARYMMKKLMGDQLFDGYMDVPAAAMSLLSIYTFIRAERKSAAEQRQSIILGVLFATGAAITKQSGLIALFLSPLAVNLPLKDAAKTFSKKQTAVFCGAVIMIVLPWYVHSILYNTLSTERELIASGITDFHKTINLHERIILAFSELGKYRYIFLLSLLLLPFNNKQYRLLFFLMSWPLIIVWAVGLSYDARNIGPALPFISLLGGLGAAGVGKLSSGFAGVRDPGKIPVWLIIISAAAAVIVLLLRLYPDARLTGDQQTKQKSLFRERLNRELLYGILGESHTGHDIYTDYPAQFLSGYAECCSSADLTDEIQVKKALEGTNINWLMIPQIMPNNSDPSKELIEQCIADGRCQKVRCSDGYYKSYCLFEIIR